MGSRWCIRQLRQSAADPQHPCSGLGFSRAFKHTSRTGQLCSVDGIAVVTGGSMRGPRCSLGRFQPMKPTPANDAAASTN